MQVVELFAGCGGLSLGFQNAGYSIVAAYDFWEAAINCYQNNFKHPIYTLDLSDTQAAIEQVSQWNPDIIIGGPPCQDFSHAGKRAEGDRANLTSAFANIVAAIRPTVFIMENVDRIQKSVAYANARKIFKEAGYGLTEKILNASFCGTPQRRKRFFCIGLLEADEGFLNTIIENNLSTRPMTVRDYLGDELRIDYYYRHPRNYNRRGVFSTDEPAPTIRGVNRPVPKGYAGHPGDAAPVTQDLRPLTTFERARLQTFPKEFKWVGSKTDLEQMIGNAVPVKLAEFVAQSLTAYFSALKIS